MFALELEFLQLNAPTWAMSVPPNFQTSPLFYWGRDSDGVVLARAREAKTLT